ncbi:MAG: hypothetical protein SFV18_20120 [Bryobacteraceae bacterium]|nr:hypothetical protein [Bryobacteraceae bacterium]
MTTTIRNLDPEAFRELKARAVRDGKTIGEAVSEAIRSYNSNGNGRKKKTLMELWTPIDLGPGTENLSMEIDKVLYGEPE